MDAFSQLSQNPDGVEQQIVSDGNDNDQNNDGNDSAQNSNASTPVTQNSDPNAGKAQSQTDDLNNKQPSGQSPTLNYQNQDQNIDATEEHSLEQSSSSNVKKTENELYNIPEAELTATQLLKVVDDKGNNVQSVKLKAWVIDYDESPHPKEVDIKRVGEYYILIGKLIEQGGFGKVYRCKRDGDDKVYACKIVPKSAVQANYAGKTPQQRNELLTREIIGSYRITEYGKLLPQGKGNHVLKLLNFHEGRSNYYFFFQYCNGGDLFDYFNKYRMQPSANERLRMMYEIALGLKQMHDLQIVHRDLKLENVLVRVPLKRGDFATFQTEQQALAAAPQQVAPVAQLNPDLTELQICDLGFARELDDGQSIEGRQISIITGTTIYASPQQIRRQYDENQKYTKKVDIWGLGLIFHFIAVGNFPFSIGQTLTQDFIRQEGIIKFYEKLRTRRYKSEADVQELRRFFGLQYATVLRDLIYRMLQFYEEVGDDLNEVREDQKKLLKRLQRNAEKLKNPELDRWSLEEEAAELQEKLRKLQDEEKRLEQGEKQKIPRTNIQDAVDTLAALLNDLRPN